MFDNIKNMANMLGQARELKQKVDQMRADMARRTIEGDAGAGAVRVLVNGNMEVQSVRLSRPLIDSLLRAGSANPAPDDANQRMVEDLIAAAVNDALGKAQEMMRDEMTKAAGGLNLPGLDKMLGG